MRESTDAYYQHGKRLYYEGIAQRLVLLKKQEETLWLNEVSSVVLQQALRHLDKAFRNFFEGQAEYPTFKKKRHQQAATYASNAFTSDGGALTLEKMDAPLAIVWHRPLPDGCKPSSVTITNDEQESLSVMRGSLSQAMGREDVTLGKVNTRASLEGMLNEGYVWAGQVVSLINDVPSVQELIERLVCEAWEITQNMHH